ncbi:MAG: UDP-N-acetylmuramoyl-tripeptide--D-alanyl-D-alanine ligase, partial [Pseudomonadota bacterium]
MTAQSLWNLSDLIAATNGEFVGSDPKSPSKSSPKLSSKSELQNNIIIDNISIDSRTIGKNELFLAIKGEFFDGHNFIEESFENGASIAIIERDWYEKNYQNKYQNKSHNNIPQGNFLIVDDSFAALINMAKYRRQQSQAIFIGVTGSVGKTSIKEMLKCALEAHAKTYATIGNFNNHIGMPLTIARINLDCKFAVLEMGMNHAGEIAELTKIAQPDVTIINNIEKVHLENFANLAGIADAKAEIFLGQSSDNPLNATILNYDNQFFDYLVRKASNIDNIISFGSNNSTPNSSITNSSITNSSAKNKLADFLQENSPETVQAGSDKFLADELDNPDLMNLSKEMSQKWRRLSEIL